MKALGGRKLLDAPAAALVYCLQTYALSSDDSAHYFRHSNYRLQSGIGRVCGMRRLRFLQKKPTSSMMATSRTAGRWLLYVRPYIQEKTFGIRNPRQH
jgi:hypothetical protein